MKIIAPNSLGQKRVPERMDGEICYNELVINHKLPPNRWSKSCVNSEYSIHQLSPYIGKLKSVIAADLIKRYSKPNELVVDPFSGSSTIPTEALLLGRKVFASDISPYSKLLTKAKLNPPLSLEDALRKADRALTKATRQNRPDLRRIPKWVRAFGAASCFDSLNSHRKVNDGV